LEVKKNDDPMADPWEKLREEKKGRVAKNVEARMRNAERDGTLERGSANKLVKNNKRLDKQRELIKERDRQRGLVAPVGVPLDVQSNAKRGKASTQLALKATQVSTASLGRFDKMREGEPERKQQMAKTVHGKKRKQQLDGAAADGGGGGTNKKFLQSEAQKSVDILQRVMNGSSSKEKERDVRKGKFARGETAYDYEFDDGLGAGSFKKKKGRDGQDAEGDQEAHQINRGLSAMLGIVGGRWEIKIIYHLKYHLHNCVQWRLVSKVPISHRHECFPHERVVT
jgi:regulator of ribosome biosynthesis